MGPASITIALSDNSRGYELTPERLCLVAFGDVNNVPFAAQADSSVSRAQVAADVAKTPGATAFGDSNNVPFQG